MEWLQMGGYAQYVWPSYALAVATVLLNIRWARQSVRLAREEVRRRFAIAEADGTSREQ
jgi:heme exporter protein CcmD